MVQEEDDRPGGFFVGLFWSLVGSAILSGAVLVLAYVALV